MAKYIATLILIGLAIMMLCGFFVIGSATYNMNHTDSGTLEHHFSIWSDITTALVSNIVISITTLISILVLAYFIVRNFRLSLLGIQLAYDRIPIEPDRGLVKQAKLTRWLSLFENSPSFI